MLKRMWFLIFLFPYTVYSNSLNLVSIEGLVEQQIGMLIIHQVYEQLDIDITIEERPARRAEQDVTSGYKDGEIMRIFEYGEQTPYVVRVPTPYYKLETRAFTQMDSGIVINTVADMRDYRVVTVLGVKHTDLATKDLEKVHSVPNSQTMMRFLAAGRADIALTNTIDGIIAIRNLRYKNIKAQSNPLAQLELYHYLHVRNAELVPIIDAKIKELIASGEMDSIIAKAEAEVIPTQLKY